MIFRPNDADSVELYEAVRNECTTEDNVQHPAHYIGGSIECIDAMAETQGVEAVKNFCICNAFKYLWRHGKKNGVEDVKKAAWYLNKFIELEEKKDENQLEYHASNSSGKNER